MRLGCGCGHALLGRWWRTVKIWFQLEPGQEQGGADHEQDGSGDHEKRNLVPPRLIAWFGFGRGSHLSLGQGVPFLGPRRGGLRGTAGGGNEILGRLEGNIPNEGGALARRLGRLDLCSRHGLPALSEIGGAGLARSRLHARRSLARGRCRRSVALPLHEPFQGLVHRRKRVDETVVGGKVALIHGHDVAVERIEPLGSARLAKSRLADEPRRLLRRLRCCPLDLSRRRFDALDQPLQLAFDRADARGLLLDAAKLEPHVGNLPLDMVQRLELWLLRKRRLEARRDLLHAGIELFDRRGGHRLADRTLEPLRHVDQTAVEVDILVDRRRRRKRLRGVARLARRHRGRRGLGFGSALGRGQRGRQRCEPVRLGQGKTRGYGADLIEGLVQPRKPFGDFFRLRLLQPAREVAQLAP